MQAVGEIKSVVQTDWRQPPRPRAQCLAVAAFGHQEDAGCGNGVGFLQSEHFGEVFRRGDDEFEAGARIGGPHGEAVGIRARVPALPLWLSLGLTLYWWIMGVERRGRGDGAVGFDLDVHGRQQSDHPGEGRGLKQRLAASDDQAVLAECSDARGGVGFGER